MSKTILSIVAILVILMGIAAIVPSWVEQPIWYSIVQLIIGVIALTVAVSDKK